ncbi:hypothetical protein BKA67DRAFT_691222 [Truncatella angustata]|uniref:GST N-terminal domain-containing protein n=1 Tax=Truncatella angustata TaxID=152316 RepID=A0A9P8UL82_9PEZI|nr:uncharacterized protein BKA67DRAFT_691222 [Truncatella angustata]KAH6654158.1 hypothetical protein BKA67DRAFT_691222 [Truncatella angustata]
MQVQTGAQFKPNLYVLSWGLYPRRITIYLKEKRIIDRVSIKEVPVTSTGLGSIPGKPQGSVPILEYAPGQYIRQSSAILEYLEDLYPEAPFMRGTTPESRARTRELLDLSNEACSFLSFYLHNGSALFSGFEKQSPEAAGQAMERLELLFSQIEDMSDPEGPFLAESGDQPGLADIVVLATVQFAKGVYGIDIVKKHMRLTQMVSAFERRDSAIWDDAPAELTSVARKFNVKDVEV